MVWWEYWHRERRWDDAGLCGKKADVARLCGARHRLTLKTRLAHQKQYAHDLSQHFCHYTQSVLTDHPGKLNLPSEPNHPSNHSKVSGRVVQINLKSFVCLKGKVMVSINDHPDIREAFKGFWMEGLDIKYSTGNAQGAPQTSRELVITNWEPAVMGGLF